MIRTGYGIPAHDGVGAGAAGKFFRRRRRRHCRSSGCGGRTPKKVGFCIKNIGYGHFFKGVFSENTLYTFSRFQKFDKILYICIFGVRFRS